MVAVQQVAMLGSMITSVGHDRRHNVRPWMTRREVGA
jgi:hypothetical protein